MDNFCYLLLLYGLDWIATALRLADGVLCCGMVCYDKHLSLAFPFTQSPYVFFFSNFAPLNAKSNKKTTISRIILNDLYFLIRKINTTERRKEDRSAAQPFSFILPNLMKWKLNRESIVFRLFSSQNFNLWAKKVYLIRFLFSLFCFISFHYSVWTYWVGIRRSPGFASVICSTSKSRSAHLSLEEFLLWSCSVRFFVDPGFISA